MKDFSNNDYRVFLQTILGTDEVMHAKDRTLWDHLVGTEALLWEWKQPFVIKNAGLFHSIYGTSQFKYESFPRDSRHIIRRLIGKEAEELVWQFCMADRSKFPWGPEELRPSLYTIEAANLIDQRDPPVYVARLVDSGHLSGAALQACQDYVKVSAHAS